MHTTLQLKALVAALVVSSASFAQAVAVPPNPVSPPILNLDTQVFTEVKQDTVIIVLRASTSSSEQDVVTKTLSQTVSDVLAELKKQDKVKVSTGSYYVRPQHDKDGKPTGWVGNSDLLLESTDLQAASTLAAQFQDKMPVANVSFTVSKAAQAQAEQSLTTEVTEAFRLRAQQMAEALGFQSFTIKELSLGGNGVVYRPQAKAMMMASPSAQQDSLAIESGTEDIRLSLQGSIYLLDKK